MGNKLSRGISEFINKRRLSTGGSSPPVTGHDPAVHGETLDDRHYNNQSFKEKFEIDGSEADLQDPAMKSRPLSAERAMEERRRQQNMAGGHADQNGQWVREGGDPTADTAALKGQDHVHNHQEEEPSTQAGSSPGPAAQSVVKEEEVDIDLTDPDVEKAAVKIQATFKGFQSRKAHGGPNQGEGSSAQPPQPTQAAEEPAVPAASDYGKEDEAGVAQDTAGGQLTRAAEHATQD